MGDRKLSFMDSLDSLFLLHRDLLKLIPVLMLSIIQLHSQVFHTLGCFPLSMKSRSPQVCLMGSGACTRTTKDL